MGKPACHPKLGLKKGPWTPEEDHKLLNYIQQHGHGNWRALPSKAALERCGKSCRLRWTNYLRPDIKRGKFSSQEEQAIVQLHALLGNRWSAIATHLPKRTDGIKNYWNTHLKKKLIKMGIDPLTHKPIQNNKNNNKEITNSISHDNNITSTLSHMAQWETARVEAEERLARQSKLRPNSTTQNLTGGEETPTTSSTAAVASNTPPSLAVGVVDKYSVPIIEFVDRKDNNKESADSLQRRKQAAGKCHQLPRVVDLAGDPPSSQSGGTNNKDCSWDTILGEFLRF